LIQQYYAKVEQIIRYGGSRNESSLRKPFQDLLEQYARSKNLRRYEVKTLKVSFVTTHHVWQDGFA